MTLRPAKAPGVALTEIARSAGAALGPGPQTVVVCGVSLDSRSVQTGDLYAALPGQHAHGADFAASAITAGAVAVLTDPDGAERLRTGAAGAAYPVPVLVSEDPRAVLGIVSALVYGRPADALHVIGITGTNGKTTTAYLIESALRALGERTGLIGTVETRIGDERLRSVRTTPESTDLHAILAVMRERGTASVVMEVSSHALSQHRVDGVVYDVAVFTNLSQDHLDFHPSMAAYFEAKAGLFTPARARRGVVCVDDEWGQALAARGAIPVVTLTNRPGGSATWRVDPGPWPSFTLRGPDADLALVCHLPGTFNVANTAMAAVTLLESGFAAADVERAMADEPVVPGRMEQVGGGPEDPRCIVDYAHTPDAVDAALAALRPSTPGRLIVVLGAGGDRDMGKRRAMGRAAARWADDLIVTDDNPRSEDPAVIREEVLTGARDPVSQNPVSSHTPVSQEAPPRAGRRTCWSSSSGRAAHIARAVRLARDDGRPADNTVVVLGKGHETGQEIAGVVHPFDDRSALAAALRDEPYRPIDAEHGGSQ